MDCLELKEATEVGTLYENQIGVRTFREMKQGGVVHQEFDGDNMADIGDLMMESVNPRGNVFRSEAFHLEKGKLLAVPVIPGEFCESQVFLMGEFGRNEPRDCPNELKDCPN
jgi:hypothetical protein